jgi:hypothetical protein
VSRDGSATEYEDSCLTEHWYVLTHVKDLLGLSVVRVTILFESPMASAREADETTVDHSDIRGLATA